jgi:hypothetical protein
VNGGRDDLVTIDREEWGTVPIGGEGDVEVGEEGVEMDSKRSAAAAQTSTVESGTANGSVEQEQSILVEDNDDAQGQEPSPEKLEKKKKKKSKRKSEVTAAMDVDE